jgi:hypothetical protein
MHTALQIGIPFATAGVGFVVGVFVGEAEGGDINIAPAIYAPIGAAVGALVGVIITAVVL